VMDGAVLSGFVIDAVVMAGVRFLGSEHVGGL
jgi:hypothetical protein